MDEIENNPADMLSDQAIEWLVRLHSGNASPSDWDAFAAWRGQGPMHEQAAREAEALWHGIGLAGSRLKTDERTARRRSVTRRAVLGIGAAGLVGAGLVQGGIIRLTMFADYSTGIGERRTIALSDGSVVELNARSALSVDYGDRQRTLLLLEGQATFTAKHDPQRPFVVRAAAGQAKATGTVFDVDMRPEDVVVTTLQGTVAVSTTGAGGEAAIVNANQRIRYTVNGPAAVEDIDANVETAWRRGKLIFNDRPLADVVAEIERYRHGKVVLVGAGLRQLAVTGVFDLTDPDSVLQTIRQTLPVRMTELPLVTIIRQA